MLFLLYDQWHAGGKHGDGPRHLKSKITKIEMLLQRDAVHIVRLPTHAAWV